MKSIHASSLEIRHALTKRDDGVIAAMRAQVAPLKGKMDGPHARGVFDEVIEHTPDAPGVFHHHYFTTTQTEKQHEAYIVRRSEA